MTVNRCKLMLLHFRNDQRCRYIPQYLYPEACLLGAPPTDPLYLDLLSLRTCLRLHWISFHRATTLWKPSLKSGEQQKSERPSVVKRIPSQRRPDSSKEFLQNLAPLWGSAAVRRKNQFYVCVCVCESLCVCD